MIAFFAYRTDEESPFLLLNEFRMGFARKYCKSDQSSMSKASTYLRYSDHPNILPVLLPDYLEEHVVLPTGKKATVIRQAERDAKIHQNFQAISASAAAGLAVEALRALADLVRSFPGGQTLVHFISFLVSIHDASSWKGVVSAFTTFSLSISALHPTLSDTFEAICSEFLSALGRETSEHSFQAEGSVWASLGDLGSALGGVFWEFASCFSVAGPLVALGFFPDGSSWKEFALNRVQPYLRKDITVESFLERFVSFN